MKLHLGHKQTHKSSYNKLCTTVLHLQETAVLEVHMFDSCFIVATDMYMPICPSIESYKTRQDKIYIVKIMSAVMQPCLVHKIALFNK